MRRKKTSERGQEIIEFALVALLFVPLMLGSFITGMNLIRSIQVNHVCRDLADMYIHGADFSTWGMQNLAKRLAAGLVLDIGTSFSGNLQTNTSNSGNGLVTISQVMYVGPTTGTNCVSVGSANCTNHDKFVFLQRIQFGNGTLATTNGSSLGNPGVAGNAYGMIANPLTVAGAAVPGSYQTAMSSLWQVNTGGRSPLVDGQVMYVVETYFKSPDLALGQSDGGGIYARYFY
jgi:hypothetical protein